jgi:hypothetical protein
MCEMHERAVTNTSITTTFPSNRADESGRGEGKTSIEGNVSCRSGQELSQFLTKAITRGTRNGNAADWRS